MCSHLTAEMPTFKMSLTQEQCKHPIHLFIVHLFIHKESVRQPATMEELFTFLNSPKNKGKTCFLPGSEVQY